MFSENSFFKKIFLARKIRFTRGKIILFERPMVFMPMRYVAEITKKILEEHDKKFMLDMYLEAWKGGVIFMDFLQTKYKMKSFEEKYHIAMETITMAGFGDYRTKDFHRGYASFEIFNNPLPEYFKPSKEPVDIILRGFNGGGGTPVHERIINTIETKCAAVEGKICFHINADTEFLRNYKNQELLNEQLDLDWLIPKQKKFLKENKIRI